MKFVMLSITFALALSLTARADDPPASEAPSFTLPSIEEKYASEASKADAVVAKAETEAAKTKKLAADARLKAYKDKLVEITKTGDFDKAQQIKAKISQLESEPESEPHKPEKPSKRPRPKDTVKFGGHTYALIKEPATWHVAKQRCEEMGGHLVCISSQPEEAFVAKLCGKNTAWIGATDEEEEGKWLNIDHTATSFTSRALFDNASNTEHWMTWDGISQHFNDLGTARIDYVCEWDR